MKSLTPSEKRQYKPDNEPSAHIPKFMRMIDVRISFVAKAVLIMTNLSIVIATIVKEETDILSVQMDDNILQPKVPIGNSYSKRSMINFRGTMTDPIRSA